MREARTSKTICTAGVDCHVQCGFASVMLLEKTAATSDDIHPSPQL